MKGSTLRLCITVALISLSTTSFAQDFIVDLKSDTIKGEVKALNFGPDKRVQITEPGKKKVIYPFFKVKSFSIDGESFQPVKGPSGYTFMKLLKSGYLSLFAFQTQNQNTFNAMYLLKKDGEGMEVPNLTFKKGMRNFLEDCPEVSDKIDNDILNKRDLNQIVDEYNACLENRTRNNMPPVAAKNLNGKTADAWVALENKIKRQPDFEGKNNALDMINEIKNKISSSQKIPNFLIEGLKSELDEDHFKTELEAALKTIN